MNDINIDKRLLAARPIPKKHYSNFTGEVMRRMQPDATIQQQPRITSKPNIRNLLMQFTKTHRAMAIFIMFIVLSFISLSGYAYAQNTDPFTLIKRWIVGDNVMLETEGRSFQHGTKLSYSDAAVTAYAEVNTVQGLYHRASNAFTVPKDGIEHVSDPTDHTGYVYPWIGTIERIDDTRLYVRKQYTPGDKMTKSYSSNELIPLPRQDISYFEKGEPRAAEAAAAGKLIMVFQDAYIRHKIGTKEVTSITQYFAFALSHELASYKEADQANKPGADSAQGIFEPSWGGLTSICMNNGADTCDTGKLGRTDEGESLYGVTTTHGGSKTPNTNPSVIPFGEMLPDNAKTAEGMITRNVEGVIVDISNPSYLTIKSSSGSHWQLAFSEQQRTLFTKTWQKPLRLGDRVGGTILESIHNLDNRTVENSHIYHLKRY